MDYVRKRTVNKEGWNRNLKKRLRHSKEIKLDIQQPRIACTHRNTSSCEADK